MSSECKTLRLDQIAQINPTRKVRKGNAVPFVDMAALPQHSRDISPNDVVIRDAKGAGAHFQNGDTLLARITPCLENGKTAQVSCLDENTIAEGSTEFIVLCGIDPADNDFIYYLCREPTFREYAIGRMEGTSGRQRVSWQSIAAYELSFLTSAERRTAAKVLATLDDRITLLRETNTTLEAIAQALFKSWFVDFDPVRAKMEGRAPEGMDEETAALFPDSFEESELGLVPRGWGVAKFGDFITRIAVGKKFDQKTAAADGLVPILDQGKSGIIGFHNEEPGVDATLNDPVVVFANHTCYMRLITFPFSAIQNVLPFRGNSVDTVWAFYATKDRVKFSEYKGHWPDFAIEKAILPNDEVTQAFRKAVDPLVRKMRLNEMKAETLASLRDTLLPRLISGQLRVGEV